MSLPVRVRFVGTAAEAVRSQAQRALTDAGLAAATSAAAADVPEVMIRLDAEETSSITPSLTAYDWHFVWTDTSTVEELVSGLRFFLTGSHGGTGGGRGRRFTSTRGATEDATFLSVVRDGLARDGGLFVLKSIPRVPPSQLRHLCKQHNLAYTDAAETILEYLVDHSMSPARLHPLILQAYDSERWSGLQNMCPLTPLLLDQQAAAARTSPAHRWTERVALLELYHGPTAAFKDFALQLFPRYFNAATELLGSSPSHATPPVGPRTKDQYIILAATSGDTGVAAISGFVNAGGPSKVMVLYPMHGVSPVQQLQMLSFDDGRRVRVFGAAADFDFCQQSVKAAFSCDELRDALAQRTPAVRLSSANSINWGRLIPQVAYYFWSYRQLVQRGMRSTSEEPRCRCGELVDIVVPCGNFGNVVSAYIAKQMGLPVRKLVVASNVNDVLYDFVCTGCYDIRRRTLHTTASPSIDILKASNVERLLYYLSDGDTALVAALMQQLETERYFKLPGPLFARMAESFAAGRCDEAACAAIIHDVYEASHHQRLLDPHTAVAVAVAKQLREAEEAQPHGAPLPPVIIASTAHWSKFPEPVQSAMAGGALTLGTPAATSAEAVERVLKLYATITARAGEENRAVAVHPALQAALQAAAKSVADPRSIAASIDTVKHAIEDFAATSL